MRLARCDHRGEHLAAANGCAAGSGLDTIKFSVTGRICLSITNSSSKLPAILGALTITGPTTSPGITIDAGSRPPFSQLMQVASGAILNIIAHGNYMGTGAGILDNGTLNVSRSTFSANVAFDGTGGAFLTTVL